MMKQWVWVPVVCVMVAGLLGCRAEEEVVELVPVGEAPAAPAKPERDVLFGEDFESGEAGRWTSVTIVRGGAGGSTYAAQGTVVEGRNPEYWGVNLAVDGELTLSLDVYFDGAPTSLQVMTFAEKAANNFRLEVTDLQPGRWHHVEGRLADFFSWEGGSLVGDVMQSLNIWVQGNAGDTFRFDNVKLFR